MAHTEGPWTLQKKGNSFTLLHKGIWVMDLLGQWWPSGAEQERYEANAHLIASAPELLEALTVIMDSVDAQKVRLDVYELELAQAAIAKATGESK